MPLITPNLMLLASKPTEATKARLEGKLVPRSGFTEHSEKTEIRAYQELDKALQNYPQSSP